MDPLSAGMSLLSAGMNLFGQNETNKMQQQMMQQQQSFQERMSSTAYQRSSQDMIAAGLNPMMMFSSGSAASTPSGATPSSSVKSGLDADTMQKAISTATQMKVAEATIDNLVEQNAKIKAETLTEGQRPLNIMVDTGRKSAETSNISAANPIIHNKALTARNEMGIPPAVRKAADQLGFGGRRVDEILSPVTSIISSAKGAKQLFTDRWHDF